jgi:hypothetical protein
VSGCGRRGMGQGSGGSGMAVVIIRRWSPLTVVERRESSDSTSSASLLLLRAVVVMDMSLLCHRSSGFRFVVKAGVLVLIVTSSSRVVVASSLRVVVVVSLSKAMVVGNRHRGDSSVVGGPYSGRFMGFKVVSGA